MASMGRIFRQVGALIVLVVCGCLASMSVAGTARAADADNSAGRAVIRRISPEQYRQIIADVFGSLTKFGGRFEPDLRENGLLAVGAGHVSVTASGFEQYDSMATTIAAAVVDKDRRDVLIPCKPASETEADEACATRFLSKAGRLLYRRPLTQEELQAWVSLAATGAKARKSFYSGLAISLEQMLVSPPFLFRYETAEPDPAHPGQYRLDAFSKASQLSFLFWNSAPDQQLLAAAENGELNTDRGLARQIDRMLASPRLEGGVRAFFSDMLGFDAFGTLAKDTAIYPNYTTAVMQNSQEQTLRTITDLLVTQKGDYRDLFTTRKTFLTSALAAVYGVPLVRHEANGDPDSWVPYEYPVGDPRSGILMQASFVALHSHPGRSSPTLRGKALRELVLCQKVPDPPGNVNFTVVQDTSNPQYKTARARVTAHRTDAVCAGCHKIMDPIGLAMENFDGAAGFRKTENGAVIDTSGEIDGVKFADGAELGKVVHDMPATTSCLVDRLYAYATGRPAMRGEAQFVKSLEKDFASMGYRFPDLLKRIATSGEFYRVSAPQTGALDVPAAKLASQTN